MSFDADATTAGDLAGGEVGSGSGSRRVELRFDVWDRAAAGIIGTFLVATFWLVAGGGLYIDDLRAQAYAAGESIWPFIVESNRTHLAPSARVIDWLQATFFPLEHWPAIPVTLAIALALGVCLWMSVRHICDHPAAALVGLYLGLFSATIVPSLAWYRQSLTALAAFALTLAVTITVVRLARGGNWGLLALACLLHTIALGFSERALVGPVLLLAVLTLLSPGGGLASLKWRGLAALGTLGMINVAFLIAYFSGDFDKATGAQPTVQGFVSSSAYSLVRNTLPAYLGGPLRWGGEGIYGFARTPIPLVVVATLGVSCILLLALRRDSRQTAKILLTAGSYIVPIYLMIYIGRVAQVSDISSVSDLRLHSDAAIVGAVALAALLGIIARSPGEFRGPFKHARGRVLILGTVIVLSMLGTATTWTNFGNRWHENKSPEYIANLRQDLATNGGTVVPGPVPEIIVPWWVQPDFNTERLVLLLDPTTDTARLKAPVMAVGMSGSLTSAQLMALDTIPTPAGFCGLGIRAGETSGQVDSPTIIPARRHQLLEIGLLVGDTTRIGVSLVTEDGEVHQAASYRSPTLHRGPNRIIAAIPAGIEVKSVIIETLDRNTDGTCVTSISAVISRATL